MSRTLFAPRCRGEIVRRIQRRLADEGLYTDTIDAAYGKNTTAAVRQYQTQHQLDATGTVDDRTWTSLMQTDIPAVADRSLQLTAAFEGHGFTLIQGNWDGAWLTWGVIGFTLKHGELSAIVLEVFDRHPEVVQAAFGDRSDELIGKMRASKAEQEAWANSISAAPGKVKVIEPCRSAYARFGVQEIVQAIQLRRVDEDYMEPARATTRKYQLRMEYGLALCFDIHVQNGGIGPGARKAIQDALDTAPPANEQALRVLIATAVADHANPEAQDDVRSRKLTIATGAGDVHGEHFELDSWGLGEYPWEQV